jgi:hypothetical protein
MSKLYGVKAVNGDYGFDFVFKDGVEGLTEEQVKGLLEELVEVEWVMLSVRDWRKHEVMLCITPQNKSQWFFVSYEL